MSAGVKLTGLDELRRQLQQLPEHLTDTAVPVVLRHAHEAANRIRANYAARLTATGDGPSLQDSVRVKEDISRAGVLASVRSSHPLVNIFEIGTAVRHTRRGWPRGQIGAGHFFIPPAIVERRDMYGDLKAMLVAEGLTVSGDVDAAAE